MGTMFAAALHDFDDLRLERVAVPRVEGVNDVVVRIKACGFCATDYKAIQGIRRNVEFPFIAVHEPSGVVVEAGALGRAPVGGVEGRDPAQRAPGGRGRGGHRGGGIGLLCVMVARPGD